MLRYKASAGEEPEGLRIENGRGAAGVGDGMARDFAIKFYNSKQWEKCREAYKRSVFGLCERCGKPGEEVHHKVHLTPDNINDPYIALSFENLELLCSSCHSIEHNRKYSATRDDVMFDEYGNLVPRESAG